jgi:transaldolase
MMKFFIDTANIDEIREAASLGILDGVTTNPSLVSKEGKNFRKLLDEILEIVDGPVSAEVIATDYDGILKEAREYADIHDNIVVKVPLIKEGLKAVRTLSDENINTNVTLCFSPSQALMAAKAGATYISPFVGRVDDISGSGMDLISQIVQIYRNYNFDTQVLVASIRHPLHLVEAALMGADVCTMPFAVINKLFNHPLTDVGLKNFLSDWEKLNEKADKPKTAETK